jgi:hypothetical protein
MSALTQKPFGSDITLLGICEKPHADVGLYAKTFKLRSSQAFQ